jgi:hypothetical protein
MRKIKGIRKARERREENEMHKRIISFASSCIGEIWSSHSNKS